MAKSMKDDMAITYEDLENLGEKYFDMSIYEDDKKKPAESFLVYGSIWELVDSMDTICLSNGFDVEEVTIILSHRNIDLVYGFHPTNPDEFAIVCKHESIKRLMN